MKDNSIKSCAVIHKLMFFIAMVSTTAIIMNLSELNRVSADPMDALNNIDTAVTTTIAPTQDPNIMTAYNPNVTEPAVTTAVTSQQSNVDYDVDDIQQNSNVTSAVRFMDTFMFVVGILCCCIPLFILGFWGVATVNPVVFDPLFNLVTLGKLHYTDITAKGIMLKSLPLIIFGFVLNSGVFKSWLRNFWYFIGDLIF